MTTLTITALDANLREIENVPDVVLEITYPNAQEVAAEMSFLRPQEKEVLEKLKDTEKACWKALQKEKETFYRRTSTKKEKALARAKESLYSFRKLNPPTIVGGVRLEIGGSVVKKRRCARSMACDDILRITVTDLVDTMMQAYVSLLRSEDERLLKKEHGQKKDKKSTRLDAERQRR